MEIPATLRAPRRRWRLWLVGALLALALGVMVASRTSSSGIASTRVVLDTPTSQVIDAAPIGAESLAWRASLLVHLMASEPVKGRLADQLGIAPGELAVVDPSLSVPEVPASLPAAAAEASAVNTAPYTVTASLDDEALPIISIEAAAPDGERAAELAAAATDELKAQAPPPQKVADVSFAEAQAEASEPIPSALQGFVVDDAAPIRVKATETGPDPIRTVGLTLLAFGLWCAGAALAPPIVGRARARLRVQSDTA
jgi:hypothetical protein